MDCMCAVREDMQPYDLLSACPPSDILPHQPLDMAVRYGSPHVTCSVSCDMTHWASWGMHGWKGGMCPIHPQGDKACGWVGRTLRMLGQIGRTCGGRQDMF